MHVLAGVVAMIVVEMLGMVLVHRLSEGRGRTGWAAGRQERS
jgi:hypothetical protein